MVRLVGKILIADIQSSAYYLLTTTMFFFSLYLKLSVTKIETDKHFVKYGTLCIFNFREMENIFWYQIKVKLVENIAMNMLGRA